ncbi:hypothetical protein F4818DRAFT_439060 [Hypoxylon cercidicola]|nr:hypothetical protein F4818DRAFT_439060 [Hypoxylon cercidicola]
MGSTPKPAQSPAASPAKGKAAVKKPSGKGITKRAGRKPGPKKGVRGKGRGQKKTYSDVRVQAAYERQKELRELYATVSMALKPSLEDMADRSVKTLLEDPESHKHTPKYLEVQQQLDDQLQRVIDAAESELRTKLAVAERSYELELTRIQQSFQNSFDSYTEDYLDGLLNRISIIEELRREGCPLNTPDLTYNYVENIPYIPCELTGEMEEQAAKTTSSTKRKAEGQPDGQRDPKKVRHTGGLLASEMQPDGVPESNAASPTPPYEPESASKEGLPDLPNGASEPDSFGVRAVDKSGKDNRFIVPQTFQWDSDEIGFRDSTNDSTRGKKKRALRGVFLDKPNSRNFHLDHTVRGWDCREYKDDTLDPELVKKHGLHPKYGIFLPTSINEAEPPAEFVDGLRPVVLVPDRNTTIHASRSVKPKKMDYMLKADAVKSNMAKILDVFCKEESISPDDIVTDEMRDRERQARERLSFPSSDDSASESSYHSPLADADDSTARDRASLLLQAADHLETDKLTVPPPSPRHSRPYDAVRDVFTSTAPAPAPTGQPSEDTHSLTILADLAENTPRQTTQADRVTGTNDFAMIDPRILSDAPPHSNTFLQTALNPTSGFMHSVPVHASSMASMDRPQPPAPAAPAAPPRNPFANQNIRDSPILPPLRPVRSDGLGKVPPAAPQQPPLPSHRPQEFGSPRGLIHTNSGTYYPPAPPRPYHQGFAFHDPNSMQGPTHGQPISGATMFSNQPQMPPHHHMYPTLSPPPMQNLPYTHPVTGQRETPAPAGSPPVPPPTAPSPPVNTPRQRGSAASNGRFRRIAAAPVAHSRTSWTNGGPELRLSHYDYRESIKDYPANENPPQSGPTTIRGWNVNNVAKGRNKGVKKEDPEEKDPPK